MKFKLNCSPHLKMHEITKKLFNNKFLSDIQFSVDGKVIYAHSLELMKRSVVFELQLQEMWGIQTIIPIADCKYENFFEFLRYLYTDECTINDRNGIELLKLATKYKVIMLESRVINLLNTTEWCFQLFEYCVIDKYEIARRNSDELFIVNLAARLKSEKFLSLQPDTVDKVIQFDAVQQGVTEDYIFKALADWIQNYCKQHQMTLTEGRQQFDGLIRKIRFPIMSDYAIHECINKYPGLLSTSDCVSISKQISAGSGTENDLWISKRRKNKNFTIEWRKINRNTSFKTTFFVTKDTILQGVWIGIENHRKEIEIEIKAHVFKTNAIEKIQFTQYAPAHWNEMLISLGDSILLQPDVKYTVTIKYLGITQERIDVICRKKDVDLIYNNPENSIKSINACDNMIEMLFKSPIM